VLLLVFHIVAAGIKAEINTLRYAPALTPPAPFSTGAASIQENLSMPSTHSKIDVYEQITNTIVAAIEAGAGKFEVPWHTLGSPMNTVTRKPYRRVNVLMLWAASLKHTYSSHHWATYRQWSELGAQVRKGQHSTIVVFWKFFDSQTEEQTEQEDGANGNGRPRC
jgi:antirestriction protein ArdC